MDKAGKEGNSWISGLFDYRVTLQSGNIASPLQLMTQCTTQGQESTLIAQCTWCPRNASNSPGPQQRQGNKPERKYQELLPGTSVWVQHRQNTTWEPAIVVNQCAPNSYWIMQENSLEQPRVYRYTRTMLKVRSTPTDGKQKSQMREWSTETENAEFHIPAIPYGNRKVVVENSQGHSLPNSLTLPLPSLDLPESENFAENREESKIAETLCTNATTLGTPDAPIVPGTCKSTCENFGKPVKKSNDQLFPV